MIKYEEYQEALNSLCGCDAAYLKGDTNKFDMLISMSPIKCEKILRKEQTIELFKTKPNIDTPFKCYIYCTKDKWKHFVQMPDKTYRIYDGREYGSYDKKLKFKGESNAKVIGEFVCDKIYEYKYFDNLANFNAMGLPNGYRSSYLIFEEDYKAMCLSYDEVKNYGKSETLYGLQISELKIYDQPKELSKFGEPCELFEDRVCGLRTICGEQKGVCDGIRRLTRPPQSWCYVEEMTE